MSQGGRPDSRVNLGCKGLISTRVGTLFSTPRGVQIRQSPPIYPDKEIEKERDGEGERQTEGERGREREKESKRGSARAHNLSKCNFEDRGATLE